MRSPKLMFKFCDFTLIFILIAFKLNAQNGSNAPQTVNSCRYITGLSEDLYGINNRFIENTGQYGKVYDRFPEMGEILFGYEGFGMPVLFTSNGIIYLHRKVTSPKVSEHEREQQIKNGKGKKEDEIEDLQIIDKSISVSWKNANKSAEVVPEYQASEYHTYGLLDGKSNAYKKITYKNLYDGVDLVYSFNKSGNLGYEYSLIAKPGSDLSKVSMVFNGDVKRVRLDAGGNLVIKSIAGKTIESPPLSYYADSLTEQPNIKSRVKSGFKIAGNEVSFYFPDGYDNTKALVIDPFVTGTGNLTGTGANSGLAKDVDFDYAGNVYVTGGGSGSVYKLAKYDAAGTLQWTFSGTLSIPSWNFGTYYGGWVVDKNTGNVYLGQGFAPGGGHRVIRINTTGVYDNYITTANGSFLENWKMYWSCNSGSPQLLIAGGGTNSNINFGVVSPPSTVVTSVNVTNIPYSAGIGWAQDIADVIIDPATNSLYTIYGSLYGTPSLANKIYKNNTPYSGATVAWNVASGFTTIQEIANRPYLVGPEIDNSCNVFAINSSYLFYWDGKNLKAINKTTGATAGVPLTTAGTALMTGGIIADECNNIFVGSTNGLIKVYFFNGTSFDDAAKPDITVAGFGTSSVFDLAFNESQKLLYASGNGFVGSFDVSNYNCINNIFSLSVGSSCATLSATTTVNPVPPAGSTVTYVLYNGATQISSNTTGIFSGLTPNVVYTIRATINQACSGTTTSTTFTLPGPTITPSIVSALCGASNGSITISASGGTGPYTYSKDGITFQPGNLFTGLASGLYTITVRDINNCANTTVVNVTNANGPSVSFTKTDATCGNNTGTITVSATGGVAPLTYSINGTTFQTNNFFTGILPGNYTLTVKDFNGCTNVTSVTISSTQGATLFAVPTSTFCNTSNGSITAAGSGGTQPLQYSINGNTFQPTGVFNNLSAGSYTVTVRDAIGCLTTTTVTIANVPGPLVTGSSVTASCNNANGSITANGSGGVTPLQYSINGTTFQASNFFGGLTAGTYIITVKDANNCTSTFSIIVNTNNAPNVTATSVASACNINTGTITAVGSGGTGLLQYSLNGTTFQASNLFSGLAAGTYTLYVRDANGCLGGIIVSVPNSASPSISTTVTPTSCSSSNGVITASGSGGTLPYQYSINNGSSYQLSNVFSGLATGPYVVIIKDVNGCTSTSSAIMTNVAGLSITASNISSACNTNNGSITAVGLGGAPPLQYSINGVAYQAGNVFNSLGGGSYTVYVKDNNGCISTTSVTVVSLLAPQISVTSTNATCGGNNAVIIATGTGGTPPLRYSINGSTYQNSGTFINVAPGTYTVYVRDTANCIQTTTATITNTGGGPGIATFTVVTDPTLLCDGDLGKITNPKVNGNTCITCTYSLNFGAYVPHTTQLFLNLNPGFYYVTAMDANGCTRTITTTVTVGVPSTASHTVTGTACSTSNGTITITGIGPNTPYHASINGIGGPWIDFGSTHTFTGLAPGNYSIILADEANFDPGPPIDPGACLDTIYVTVPATGGPSVSASQTSGTCGLSNGSINATGTGGTGALSYSLNGVTFQVSGIFNGLAAGNYTVTVMDGTGCRNIVGVTVSNSGAPSATASIVPASCGNPNGVINVTGTGGTPPLLYSINGTVFQSSGTFSGLAAGSYTLRIGDAGGCISSLPLNVTAVPRPTVTAFAFSANCNVSNGAISATGLSGSSPYQYSIDGITFQSSNLFLGLASGFYTVTIRDANGCLNTTGISIGNLLAPIQTLTATPATCLNANGSITSVASGGVGPLQYSLNGISYQSSNIFTGLSSGSYTVYVKDANSCISTKNVLVTSPIVPQTLSATITNSSCGNNNGSIIAAATGGVAPLQYSINGTVFQASATFSSLAQGTYPLTVRDANLCTKLLNITVINLPGPTLSATSTLSSCFANDGTITASAVGGNGAIQYSKNGTIFQASPVFTALAPGNYTITARDARLCITTASVTVGKVTGPTISATTSLSICGDTIIVGQTGGTAIFQYNINSVPYQTSNLFPCQLPGTYKVRIVDANGCRDSLTLTILSPLPVELLYFNGENTPDGNLLKWETASEINNDYFILERSKDAVNFTEIAKIDGSGNTNVLARYQFLDKNYIDIRNYYRLKQTDFNGNFELSKTILLSAEQNFNAVLYQDIEGNMLFANMKLFNEDATFMLRDVSGKLILKEKFEKLSINKLSISHVAKGVYIASLSTTSQTFIEKLTIK